MQGSRRRRPGGRARGFSLVEVLISIIVLSFGLLGMVGLQAAALQANREARLQSVAFGLAQELAEMMRGNNDIGIKVAADNPYSIDHPGESGTPSYCLSVSINNCEVANQTMIAQSQVTEWLARVDDQLPGARVVVCSDSDPYGSDNLPRWGCTKAAAGAAGVPYVIKIGWTQSSTNRDVSTAAKAASALIRTDNTASRPALVFPVISGSKL